MTTGSNNIHSYIHRKVRPSGLGSVCYWGGCYWACWCECPRFPWPMKLSD